MICAVLGLQILSCSQVGVWRYGLCTNWTPLSRFHPKMEKQPSLQNTVLHKEKKKELDNTPKHICSNIPRQAVP
jgi:hypothetical protein